MRLERGGVPSPSTWRRPSGQCYRTHSSFSVFRRGQLDGSWFNRTPGVCLLSEKGRIKTTERFWSRIEEQFGNLTFRQTIHRQCLSLEREALGIGQFKPFVWRG